MSQIDTRPDDAAICPECGGQDVEFYEDLVGLYQCHDCDEIVGQWTRERRGGPLNTPGTYQWQARRRSR